MSLQPQAVYLVPEETARVARAAFPRGNVYLRMHDELGHLYADQQFAALFPTRGQPACAPAQLALVAVMQFAEGLSDRQAAEAVRGRIDWKYALCLELPDAGFDASVLSEFRTRLLAGEAGGRLFNLLLARCRQAGLLRSRGRQRTDSTHVPAAIRLLNRLELVGATLRHALHTLAGVVPDWLRRRCPADWADRYGPQLDEYRLPREPAARAALAAQIGADGPQPLRALWEPAAPAWLRQVRVQQYRAPGDTGAARWRADDDLPPAAVRVDSPHDPEARYGTKREPRWTGYTVHLAETRDAGTPHLLTDVQTTLAAAADNTVTAAIHADLAEARLLPRQRLVDAGYVDADNLVTSRRDHGVDRVGPALGDHHWQARTDGAFDGACFAVEWDARRVVCPRGCASVGWSETRDPFANAVLTGRFGRADCAACPARARCRRAARGPRRLTRRPRPQHRALRAARARQGTPEFKAEYAARAGVEGRRPRVRRGGRRVCRAGGGGGPPRARHPRRRSPAGALCRAGQDAAPASAHGRRHELRPVGSLVRGEAPRGDTASAAGRPGRVRSARSPSCVNSPAASGLTPSTSQRGRPATSASRAANCSGRLLAPRGTPAP